MISFYMVKLNTLVISLTFIIFSKIALAKNLECKLGFGLLKTMDKEVIEVNYDEKAFKSNAPVSFRLDEITFLGEKKTIKDDLLNEYVDVIQSEKTISGVWHSLDYSPKRKILVYSTLNKNDTKSLKMGIYECK